MDAAFLKAQQKKEGFDVSSFEKISEAIPELKKMKEFDQRTDFHDLTLEVHTQEVVKHLEEDPFVSKLEKKELVLLAGYLHDLGKISEEGTQIHPKDPEKRQYAGHEKVSENMTRDILSRSSIKLEAEDLEFVAKLVGLHASALNLVNNFEKNNQPKGKELGAYDDFIAKVEQIPGSLSLIEKMKLVFAFNKADVLATHNENSDQKNEKVTKIIERATKSLTTLNEMEKALSVLIEAVQAKRAGAQQAAVVFQDGKYIFENKAEAQKNESASLDESSFSYISQNLDKIGIEDDKKEEFLNILKKDGIPGLGKSGFGKQIGLIKRMLSEQK